MHRECLNIFFNMLTVVTLNGKFQGETSFCHGGWGRLLKSAVIVCKGAVVRRSRANFFTKKFHHSTITCDPPIVMSVPWSYPVSRGDWTLTGWP